MMGMEPHREIKIQQDRTTSILFQLLELIVMRHEMKGIYDNSIHHHRFESAAASCYSSLPVIILEFSSGRRELRAAPGSVATLERQVLLRLASPQPAATQIYMIVR